MIYLTLLAALFVSLAESTQHDSRIINGVDAPNTPWVARIIYKYNEYYKFIEVTGCGGSLVAPNWVLTAAHCVSTDDNKVGSNNMWVSVGNVNFNNGQIRKVSRHYVYANYTSSEYGTYGDLALLKLERSVDGITPVHVELRNNLDYSGQLATVYGWGSTDNVNDGVDILQTTNLEIFDGYICKPYWICINPELTNSNICGGDSGGPLAITENGITTLIGVVSGGGKACEGILSVFTRTSYFGTWIKATIAYN